MAEEKTGPKGITVVDYPWPEHPDAKAYICQTCVPQWDSFDEKEAKAHNASAAHAEGTRNAKDLEAARAEAAKG